MDNDQINPNTASNSNEASNHLSKEVEHTGGNSNLNVMPVKEAFYKVSQELSKVIIGQHELMELLFAGLLANGHVLLEGLPGIAKTLMVKSLAKALDLDYSRIQFTPDLMPSDVTGTSIFNTKTSNFEFRPGPVFSNFVLIDEINRAPAKTQAALMEVMEERQITYDGKRYEMQSPFFVIATQNPIEQEGTYALPEAQLDRFMFRIKLHHPELNEEFAILKRFASKNEIENIANVLSASQIEELKSVVDQVYIKDDLLQYVAEVMVQTRNSVDLFLGASPRASLAIVYSSKALAAIRGRDFVTPDDIKNVATAVLNHRLILSHEKEMEGVSVEEVISGILEQIEIPR